MHEPLRVTAAVVVGGYALVYEPDETGPSGWWYVGHYDAAARAVSCFATCSQDLGEALRAL
ncbi:MAG TPA: hypothetical protein VNA20_11750 [Frankiaceae bacterium]|nr:hypothetical protein [Frankiaceae bacterium]